MKRKLKSSFLFLAVTLSSLGLTYGLNAEQLKQGLCGDNPIQGLSHMKFGYDLSDFTIKDFTQTRREEIFVYTCKNNGTVSHHGTKFTYPDQFAPPLLDTKKTIDKNVTFTSHLEDFVKETETGIKSNEKSTIFKDIGDNIIAGSLFGEDSQMVASVIGIVGNLAEYFEPIKPHTLSRYCKYFKSSEYRLSMNLHLNEYELAFRNSRKLKLEDAFVEDYKALPASFLDEPRPFFKFIERYGTHYMYKAQFGGQIKFHKQESLEMLKIKTKEEIEQSYKIIISELTDKTNESREIEDEKAYQNIKAEVIGGDVSLAAAPFEELKEWEKSIHTAPSLVGVSLVPIIELIPIESIQIQLAQATLYYVDKKTIERYKELLNIIHKNSTPKSLPEMKGVDNYAKHFDEVKGLLEETSVNIKSMLKKCDKNLRNKVSKLSIFYQNIKAIGDLYEEMKKYFKVRQAVFAIHMIVAAEKLSAAADKGRWFNNDTGFDDLDEYDDKFLVADKYFVTLGDDLLLHDPKTTNKLNEMLYGIKKGNDKYLSLRTFDCENLGEGRSDMKRVYCYQHVLCGLRYHMNGWNPNITLSEYEDKQPQIKYLKIMLTPMHYKEIFEDHRLRNHDLVNKGGTDALKIICPFWFGEPLPDL